MSLVPAEVGDGVTLKIRWWHVLKLSFVGDRLTANSKKVIHKFPELIIPLFYIFIRLFLFQSWAVYRRWT